MDRYGHVARISRVSQQPAKNYNKLLAIVLKRVVHHTLANALKSISMYSADFRKKVTRIEKIAFVNQQLCLAAGWRRLKAYSLLRKSEQKVLRHALVLARRIQLQWVRESFCKIKNQACIVGSSSHQRMSNLKRGMMGQCLKKLYIETQRAGFNRLKHNLLMIKVKKRALVINTVFRGAQKRSLLLAWSKLVARTSQKKSKEKDMELEELQIQLQDMKIQVQNKNGNISRLQEQISQLRQNSIIRPNDTSSFMFNNSFGNRSASQMNRSRSKANSNFDKESNDGSVIRDGSFGSLLGMSVLSYRSRGSNQGNKEDECACSTCNYREKYEKHKATNETLKKQLEIIKTELDFTKDMNEHMENEIKAHFGNEDKERKMEKLRSDLRESQKDREVLREKVLKYEKYVAKLKVEFKAKIEEIYRRVKRNGV